MGALFKWLIVIISLNVGILLWRLLSSGGMRHAQLFRLQNLLLIQFFMAIFSTLLYRRIHCLMSRKLLMLRIMSRIGVCFLISMAHFSWFCFYIYLPDNSILALISFLCVSIYAHLAVFLLALIGVEFMAEYVFPDMQLYLLKSKNFHTILAFFLALSFTCVGVIVTQRQPLVKNKDVYIPGLAKELDGFSIGLVTDVHVGPTVGRARVETIVDVVNNMDVDIVAIAGDLVDGFISNLGQRAQPFRKLRSRFGTFFATGNHEYYHGDVDNWIEFFRNKLNLIVLRNAHEVIHSKSVTTSNSQASVCVVGVDDIVTEQLLIDGHMMNAEKALMGCPDNSTIIMLAHQPNAARKIIDHTKRQIHLILSGHTHGGQFYIFWLLAYWHNAFLHGLYRDTLSGTQVYVSSGVNYWGPPVKMWDLCEVVRLRLRIGERKIMSEFDREPLNARIPSTS